MKKILTVLLISTFISSISSISNAQQLAINDSFADGGRDNGVDAYDSNWWTTSRDDAIEVKNGSLGLISGPAGRGIRTTFAPQPIERGKTVRTSITFTTPETVGSNRKGALRIGMYDKLNRKGLEADLTSASDNPNFLYDGLPGYMIDFDVNLTSEEPAGIDIRRHENKKFGRLLSTTKGYTKLGGGGDPFTFEPNSTYKITMELKKVRKGIEVSAALLAHNGNILSKFSLLDEGGNMNTIGMLAFHVNSKTFGSSNEKNTPDNGIDFTNVKVETSVARRGYR